MYHHRDSMRCVGVRYVRCERCTNLIQFLLLTLVNILTNIRVNPSVRYTIVKIRLQKYLRNINNCIQNLDVTVKAQKRVIV